MSTENSKMTNNSISESIKSLKSLLEQRTEERRRANMTGKGNAHKRLGGKIMVKGYNEKIIEEACKIIEILKEENEELTQTIKDIQSRPPR